MYIVLHFMMLTTWCFRYNSLRIINAICLLLEYSGVKLCEIFVLDMRRDIQEIFRVTPHEKQVMMFSATLSKEVRPICKKFMQDVIIRPQRRIAVGSMCRSGVQWMLV